MFFFGFLAPEAELFFSRLEEGYSGGSDKEEKPKNVLSWHVIPSEQKHIGVFHMWFPRVTNTYVF